MDNFSSSNRAQIQLKVLISSRTQSDLDLIETLIGEFDEQPRIMKRFVSNGHIDPLYDLDEMPDLLILNLSKHWQGELDELLNHSAANRPPVLVVGDQHNPEIMRKAMQAGARDFLNFPINQVELHKTLKQISREKQQAQLIDSGHLTAVINAKGGSGASMLACNLAYLMQTNSNQHTILMDLDMQFGSLAEYLNLKPENGIADALKVVDELDETALTAYLVKHKSGLQVLGSTTNTIRMPNQTPEQQINRLLKMVLKNCNQLVVDLPRMIDRTAIAVLQNASRIVVVVQQDLINVRDAIHMMHILRNELAILDDQIIVAVNRFDKKAAVSVKDIEESLKVKHLVTIPNDYRTSIESLNKGEPISVVAKRSALSRSLNQLQADLIRPDNEPVHRGALTNLFSRLTGG
ncbi:MAG: P-loop NTPase [Amphritea sp.]|nr:P-loop NTPase [Amphritea sp.]MBQ0783689.1 P-loop NTPase [Amphritea sp.]